MDNFKITKTILENINEQNDRINECVDIVNGYTTDEETRVNQELQRQENELRREEQYNNNENRFATVNEQLKPIKLLKSNGIDDTQNILSQLQSNGEVRLDIGEYIISNISLNSKNKIIGKGKGTVLKAKTGTTGSLITLSDDNVTEVCISNLVIDGNKENANLSDCIYFNKNTSAIDLFSELSKLVIKRCKGNGIHFGNGCREITLSEIDLIQNDGYGLYNQLGSDNKFINITAAQNLLGGIKETGASNRWVNIKTFYNGDKNNRSTGFWVKGTKSITITNVESQENFGIGLFIDNCTFVFGVGITVDSNGITSFDHVDSDLQYAGIKILDSMYINLQGNILNYRTTKCQKCGIEIDGNGKSYYNFSVSNQEENYKIIKGLFETNIIINGKVEIEQPTNNLVFKRQNGNATLNFYDGNGVIKQVITSTDAGNCTKWDCQDNSAWYGTPIKVFDNGDVIFGANGRNLGFFTSNGIPQQTAVENATDLNSAIALVNNLKSILAGYGLIK